MRIKKITNFSDDMLLSLSRIDNYLGYGIAPWVNWESENAGYGTAFRSVYNFPKLLPLCIMSDHGVPIFSHIWPNDLSNSKYYNFTSNFKKYENLTALGIRSVHIKHPWISWSQQSSNKNTDADRRKGTIVFWPHSNESTVPIFESTIEDYISDLLDLPETYKPIYICLMSHDIIKGVHLQLRKYKLPIVTAGSNSSRDFIFNFYKIIRNFKYATSPNIGSHFYYSFIDGNIFFFLGKVFFRGTGKGAVPANHKFKHGYNITTYEEREVEGIINLLSYKENSKNSKNPRIINHLNSVLGLNSTEKKINIRIILYLSMIENLNSLPKMYYDTSRKLIRSIWRGSI